MINHSNPSKRSPGFRQPFNHFNPDNIVELRAPTTQDIGDVSTLWVQPKDTAGAAQDLAWILTNVGAAGGTWSQIAFNGAAANFTTLTTTGQVNLDTTLVGANTIGNTAGATSVDILVGTGGFVLEGDSLANVLFGEGIDTGSMSIFHDQILGNLTIGGTGPAVGNITIAGGTDNQTIAIANNDSGAKTVNIANGLDGNVVTIASGDNTSAQVVSILNGASGANSTLNIMNAASTAGTQTVNIMGSLATRGGTINIGTGTDHDVNIGGAGSSQTTINSGILALPGPIFIYTGSGAPSNLLAVHAGDEYTNLTPTGANDRKFIATGPGAWTNFTFAS